MHPKPSQLSMKSVIRLRANNSTEDLQRLAQMRAHCQAWIEASVRVLVDHLVPSTRSLNLTGRDREPISTLHRDRPTVRLDNSQETLSERRLS
jgi:hypothetical protein